MPEETKPEPTAKELLNPTETEFIPPAQPGDVGQPPLVYGNEPAEQPPVHSVDGTPVPPPADPMATVKTPSEG